MFLGDSDLFDAYFWHINSPLLNKKYVIWYQFASYEGFIGNRG